MKNKKEYDLKYQRENLVQINIKVKPEIKKEIEEAAAKAGQPTRAFIIDAIYEKIRK